MLGHFLKIDYIVVKLWLFFMGNDGISSKQVGSQASRGLAWIQPVCISINAVPTLKGLTKLSYLLNPTHCMLYIHFSTKKYPSVYWYRLMIRLKFLWDLIPIHIVCKSHLTSTFFQKFKKNLFVLFQNFWRALLFTSDGLCRAKVKKLWTKLFSW